MLYSGGDERRCRGAFDTSTGSDLILWGGGILPGAVVGAGGDFAIGVGFEKDAGLLSDFVVMALLLNGMSSLAGVNRLFSSFCCARLRSLPVFPTLSFSSRLCVSIHILETDKAGAAFGSNGLPDGAESNLSRAASFATGLERNRFLAGEPRGSVSSLGDGRRDARWFSSTCCASSVGGFFEGLTLGRCCFFSTGRTASTGTFNGRFCPNTLFLDGALCMGFLSPSSTFCFFARGSPSPTGS
jgi:hypothetical protein